MKITQNPAYSRILPFAIFLSFIGIGEVLQFLNDHSVLNLSALFQYYLYPVKAISAAIALLIYLPRYLEIDLHDIKRFTPTFTAMLFGLTVFVLWINMDFGTMLNAQGFNPNLLSGNFTRTIFLMLRFFGLVLVVPVMEELFWRSFLIRYLIDNDFSRVPIGRFTWPSFIISTILFGLEHHLILAGIMAGAAYNILLYRTKSIVHCIIAHAVTNLALGIYILYTGKWYFW